ncbi:hypothetical protein JW968_06220 [Candidatus Woesearchaeota archaeon]|nr:hypothetical protein [Candidatus Woesearchaeota archaeon]
MSSIIFLGTGTGPELVGKGSLTSAGIVIKTQKAQFHIDPGIGTLLQASKYNVNVRETTGILVSHCHLNHSNDLNALIYAMTQDGLDSTGILAAPVSVLGSEDNLPVLHPHMKNHIEKIFTMEPGKRIAVEDTEIVALKARHSDPFAVGYRLITPDFNVVCTGDTEYFGELAEQYAGADIIIANMPCQKSSENNLCPDDLIKILDKVKPKLLILTHFSKELYQAGPINFAREIRQATGVQTIVANDGISIVPSTYSDLSQKTLGKF